MSRSLSVAVLILSLVLNGCASPPQSTQPEALAEQRLVWDPPPEQPKGLLRTCCEDRNEKGGFGTWCKEHPWKAGIAATCFAAGTLAVLFVGAVAYGLSTMHGRFGPT